MNVNEHKSIFPLGANVSSKSRMRFCEGSPSAPQWITSADKATVTDEQGRRFVDLTAGLGSITLGHRHDSGHGSPRSWPLPSWSESLLADRIQELVPWAEKMRFMKNGADATCAAVRIARIYTGRDRILDLGNYHGCQDQWITQEHEGVPSAVRDLTVRRSPHSANDWMMTNEGFACAILEAAPLHPLPAGFLRQLRDYCTRTGTVLIFDCIISGFRAHRQGAAGLSGVIPDLACMGKAMGNSWPISAVMGRGDILDCWARTHLSATHWADPASMDAAITNLNAMEAGNFWERQAAWTWGGQPSNGYWSVVQMPMLEQTYAQLLLLRMGILTNFSMFYYMDLDPWKDSVEQAFADALGSLAAAKTAGTDLTTLIDCEVNRTTFKRN